MKKRALAKLASPGKMSVDEVVKVMSSPGLGFERIEHIRGSTYKDNSTVLVIPTRGKYHDPEGNEVRGLIHERVVQSWQNLRPPMNDKRTMIFASGF